MITNTYDKDSEISSNNHVDYRVTDTSRRAYAETGQLRNTELRAARQFFHSHPNGEYSRADLCAHLDLPINHITRIVYDLLDEGYISVSNEGANPRTGRKVEYLKLARNE